MTLKAHRSFKLTIPSQLEKMGAVHALIEEAVQEYSLEDDLAHWIELSINESMINAIQHGNNADPRKEAPAAFARNCAANDRMCVSRSVL